MYKSGLRELSRFPLLFKLLHIHLLKQKLLRLAKIEDPLRLQINSCSLFHLDSPLIFLNL